MNRAVGLLIARVWMNVCAFGSFIAVGRFLNPAEFGFYAACSSVVFLFLTVVGAGFAEHVISRDPERRDEAAAFWCATLTGIVCALVTALLGFVAQSGLHNSYVALVFFLLSPLPVLWGASVIHEATLIRDGRGGRLAAVLVSAESIGLMVLLIALAQGAGIYSLVASRLANSLVTWAGYSWSARTRLKTALDIKAIVRMARFSLGVLGARLVNWVDSYGADIVLVALLSPAGLGFYRMGARLNAAGSSVVLQATWSAQQAYLGARAAHYPERLGRALQRALRLHFSIALPVFTVVAVCAYDLVLLLLGPGWEAAGRVFAVLAAATPVSVLTAVSGAALVARGLSRQYFWMQTLAALCGTGALIAAAAGGPIWAALGKAAVMIALPALSLFWVRDIAGAARARLYKAVFEIALAGLVCAATAYFALGLIPHPHGLVPGLTRLALVGVAALAAYAIVLPFASPATWRQLAFIAKRVLARLHRNDRPAMGAMREGAA